jgi:hypothetical protein
MIKNVALAFFLSVGVSAAVAQEAEGNLIRNGDFSKGKSGWDGDGSVQEIEGYEGGKALRVKLSRSDVKYLTTNLEKTSKFSALNIKFKAKTSEDFERNKGLEKLDRDGNTHQMIPDGSAFSIELVGSGYFIYKPFKLKELNEWQDFSVTIPNTARGDAGLRFNFFVPPGRGELYFDDIVITPAE